MSSDGMEATEQEMQDFDEEESAESALELHG